MELKKGTQSIDRASGGWSTKLHKTAASDRGGVMFALSADNRGDAPEGRSLQKQLDLVDYLIHLLMHRVYEKKPWQ